MIPKVNEKGMYNFWKPLKSEDHMIPRFKKHLVEDMTYLINYPPKYDPGKN